MINRSKNLNLVESNETNNLNTQKAFNKSISPKILSLQRETNIVLLDDMKSDGKRAISGDKVKSNKRKADLALLVKINIILHIGLLIQMIKY